MAPLEIVAGLAKQRKSLLEVIGEERHSKQIGGCALVVRPHGFRPQFAPILNRPVAAPKPCQGNEIGLLKNLRSTLR
jgi:hypothetical protein